MSKDLNMKKHWTDEERLELAAKLDADLDEFIDSLEKKRYEEGWPEDRWQEEMDKHPFFMKKAPQPGEDVHPMFEGLQKLKYDPAENTKEELALNYKEDGNFYMKHKKFRMAIYSFSEGLKANCDKAEVQAVLYNNRSAAHFFLKNYRSALKDAQQALKYQPNYLKAQWRAAQCAYHLNRYALCSQLCEEITKLNADNQEAKDLLKQNKLKEMEFQRNQRKETYENRKRLQNFERLRNALKVRQVKFDDAESDNTITEELLQPKFLPLESFPVHFDEDNNKLLIWPAAFSYPEFLFSDFQQQLCEEATMLDALQSLFSEPLPCDKRNDYRVDSVNVYYENRELAKVYKVQLDKTIKEIITEKNFYVTGGSLLFYVVPAHSQVEQDFIRTQRRPMIYSYISK